MAGRLFSEQQPRIRYMQQKRSNTTYKRKELLFEAQNTSETYVFLASPPQAPIFFGGFAPPYFKTQGGQFFLPPPIFRDPGGEMKKPFPPHMGGGQKNTPVLGYTTRFLCAVVIRLCFSRLFQVLMFICYQYVRTM